MDVRFISVDDKIDSYLNPSSMSNIAVSFKNLIYEDYGSYISNKIKSVFVDKRKNGEYICGFALYGYVRDPENKGKLLIDPEAAAVVKQIFQWFKNGMSFSSITFKLNELGIPNPTKYKSLKCPNYHHKDSSGLWNIQAVRSILMNRMYTGDLVQGKYQKASRKTKKINKLGEEHWVIVEDHHDAIIDKKTFFQLQEYLNRDIRVSQNTKELDLFAGFLKCADCGCQMVKKRVSKEKYRGKFHYYACRTYESQTKSACTRHIIRSDKLTEAVLLSISKLIDIAVDIHELNPPPKFDKLTREILLHFVDVIYVYEGGKIDIVFNFIDEFKNNSTCN